MLSVQAKSKFAELCNRLKKAFIALYNCNKVLEKIAIPRKIGLGHLVRDFCRNCRDEEENKTLPHLLCTCPVICQRRRKNLGINYIDDLGEMSMIDIGRVNRFI